MLSPSPFLIFHIDLITYLPIFPYTQSYPNIYISDTVKHKLLCLFVLYSAYKNPVILFPLQHFFENYQCVIWINFYLYILQFLFYVMDNLKEIWQ